MSILIPVKFTGFTPPAGWTKDTNETRIHLADQGMQFDADHSYTLSDGSETGSDNVTWNKLNTVKLDGLDENITNLGKLTFSLTNVTAPVNASEFSGYFHYLSYFLNDGVDLQVHIDMSDATVNYMFAGLLIKKIGVNRWVRVLYRKNDNRIIFDSVVNGSIVIYANIAATQDTCYLRLCGYRGGVFRAFYKYLATDTWTELASQKQGLAFQDENEVHGGMFAGKSVTNLYDVKFDEYYDGKNFSPSPLNVALLTDYDLEGNRVVDMSTFNLDAYVNQGISTSATASFRVSAHSTPGSPSWSAWLDGDGIRALSDPTGRYLSLEMSISGAGYDNPASLEACPDTFQAGDLPTGEERPVSRYIHHIGMRRVFR